MLDTFEVTQIVNVLRPLFLSKNILLLTCAEIYILAAHQDGTYHGIARNEMTREAYNKLQLWSSFQHHDIHNTDWMKTSHLTSPSNLFSSTVN